MKDIIHDLEKAQMRYKQGFEYEADKYMNSVIEKLRNYEQKRIAKKELLKEGA